MCFWFSTLFLRQLIFEKLKLATRGLPTLHTPHTLLKKTYTRIYRVEILSKFKILFWIELNTKKLGIVLSKHPHSYMYPLCSFLSFNIYLLFYLYMPYFVQLFQSNRDEVKTKTNLIRLFILLIRFFFLLSILYFKVYSL